MKATVRFLRMARAPSFAAAVVLPTPAGPTSATRLRVSQAMGHGVTSTSAVMASASRSSFVFPVFLGPRARAAAAAPSMPVERMSAAYASPFRGSARS